jgi:hypothetical protein
MTDYTSAADAFAAMDAVQAEVASRLRALAAATPSARAFTASLLADLERHAATRSALRQRLGLGAALSAAAAASAADAAADPPSLEGLRAAQEKLVYAHAEGLPAIGDASAVDALAHDMVDLSRHLTVTTLWIEAEAERG